MVYSAEQLADLQAIRDATLRYCRGVDRLDLELMRSAYWEDASDDHGLFVGNAWEFCEFCMTAHDGWRSTSHCIYNHSIEFDDDIRARGELYVIAYLFRADEEVLDSWIGRYLDRYEKRGDEWRIIERVCVHEGNKSEAITAVPMDSSGFRQGDFDRRVPGRKLGPGAGEQQR